MKFTNRTILITGGATGIGFSLAKQLVSKNNKVIVCGRNQGNLNKAKQQLSALETIRCDINDSGDLNDLASYLSAKYPQLDTLINNAGIQQQIDLTSGQINDQTVVREIDTNLTAHINITHRLYSLLSANKRPIIVFTGSALALVPKYTAPFYSAAKAGLHNYVQSLRHQTLKDDFRIIEIFPDVVETPMTQERVEENKMGSDDFATQVVAQLEMNKMNIFTGRTKLLNILNRFMPTLALKAINKTQATV